MDTTRTITYRGFTLNDPNIQDSLVGGGATGTGIAGCVVDSADFSDVDVVQFLEKRSQQDGMDAGNVFLGTRRVRISGTLYNTSRNLLFDDLFALRAAFSPVLAQRESPLDRGYRPLYFSVPTDRTEDYPDGVIDMRILAMPRAFQAIFQRNSLGGIDTDALAIPWTQTLICKDPSIEGATPQTIVLAASTEITTGVTFEARASGPDSWGVVKKTAHGFSVGQSLVFTAITWSGAHHGLSTGVTYYVISAGLTSGEFEISTTPGGTHLDFGNATSVHYTKNSTLTGTINNRGNYLSPVNMLLVVDAVAGSVSATIGDSVFTITIPASTGERTIRFKGEDKVLTVEEDSVELLRMDLLTFSGDTSWPLISPGASSYSVTRAGDFESGSSLWFWERYA